MPVYRATWTLDHPSLGGTGTNTWHARTISETDPGVLVDLNILNGMLGRFYTAIESVFAGGTVINFDGEWVEVGSEDPDIKQGDGNNLAVVGTAEPLPPATALVVGWRTSSASRRGRGRTFLGPLSVVTLQDNGSPTEVARTQVEEAAADFVEEFDGAVNGAFGVWSVADSVLRDFTQGRVANRFASLRSRRD